MNEVEKKQLKIYFNLLKSKSMIKKKEVKFPSAFLSAVLSDYGYDLHQQEGLMQLLLIYGECGLKDFCSKQDANQWLKNITQRLFLRSGERWDEKNNKKEAELFKNRSEVMDAVKLLGFLQEEIPSREVLNNSHLSIIPGALEERFNNRIDSLVHEIRRSGKTPDVVVAATGKRVLIDEECASIELPERTEEAMIKYHWDEAKRTYPLLDNIPFHVVKAKLKKGQRRSTTEDIVEVLQNNEIIRKCDSIVVHIEKPYAIRCLPIFKQLSKNVFLYAQAARVEELPLFIYADEIARAIYFKFPALDQKYKHEDTSLLKNN